MLVTRVQLFVISWTSLLGSSVHGISQARILGRGVGGCLGEVLPSPRDFPNPGIEPGSPALADGLFTIGATREAQVELYRLIYKLFGAGV